MTADLLYCGHCGAGNFIDIEGLRFHWIATVTCPTHPFYVFDQATRGRVPPRIIDPLLRDTLTEPRRKR